MFNVTSHVTSSQSPLLLVHQPKMSGQAFLRRLNRQIQTRGGGGKGPQGAFAGSAAVVALIVGGLTINAALFNGALLRVR